jgi:hypothetical protein
MTRLHRAALIGLIAGFFTIASAGCEEQTPAEKAAEKVGDAVEDAGDAIEDTADEAKDKAEEAAEKIDENTR